MKSMKPKYVVLILLLLAWPLYFLYQHQLGAISFLLLAILFLYISIKELSAEKERKAKENGERNKPDA
ncbi:hypothetical protein [Bacillus sp. B-jedd]|uniref:hypothetical protein n=1 Tax=Bacillus sp. B-jedd TaxID=1476857 RepID=UPI0005155BF6|nr:hypothetical protein [Bacillus sp. B-jedd]CEG29217.1 hypothetical protein BN1002_04149 [Bacillus sp. B-jedd]